LTAEIARAPYVEGEGLRAMANANANKNPDSLIDVLTPSLAWASWKSLTTLCDLRSLRWKLHEYYISQSLLGIIGDAYDTDVGGVIESDPFVVGSVSSWSQGGSIIVHRMDQTCWFDLVKYKETQKESGAQAVGVEVRMTGGDLRDRNL
jgi:hypothetical protein